MKRFTWITLICVVVLLSYSSVGYGALGRAATGVAPTGYSYTTSVSTGGPGWIWTANSLTSGTGLKFHSTSGITGNGELVWLNPSGLTTGTVLYAVANSMTTGNLLKLEADNDTLTTGKYINCLGGTLHDTTVWSIGEDGATVIASTVATTTSLGITNNAATTGDLIVLTADDDTLTTGSYYLRMLGGTDHATEVFSIAEGGATLITPSTASAAVDAISVNGTVTTTGDLLQLKAVDATLNGGLYINCLGGTGTTAQFTVAEGGVTAITQTATAGYGLAVSRNLAAASTDSPLVYFLQDITTDDQAVLKLKQDATTGSTLIADFVGAGAATVFSVDIEGDVVAAGAMTFGGGYGSTGATISTAGVVQANGALTIDGAAALNGGITVDTTAFAVADTTGIVTLINGATIDNNTSATVLNLTETTVRATGILDVTGNSTLASLDVGGGSGASGVTITAAGAITVDAAAALNGGITVDSTAFAVADVTGVVTLTNGATIDNNASATVLNLTETTVRATGILDVTGNSTLASLDVGGGSGGSGATITATGALTVDAASALNGGITVDTTAFAVADTTGIVTLIGGASIDNNTSATVLNLTETTVRATGILDVTGNSTLASLDVGGGSGASGVTITTAGAITADGASALNGGITVDATAFAVADVTGVVTLIGGATIDNNADVAILNLTETTVRATGILDVTGNSTLLSLDVGGGSGASGITVTSAGAITVDALATLNGGIVCDVNKFAVADTTGIVTLGGAGTIDNNTDAAILNLTETTVRATGILDVTGNSTLASADVGGGYGSTGATITAAGNISANGNLVVDGTTTLTGAVTAGVVAIVSEATASRVCTSADYGKTIIISTAGACAVTLPANGAAAGSWIRFVVTGSDATVPTISAATADTLITTNDAAADSVTYGAGQRIGACVYLISDGTAWIAINQSGNTMTINT